MAEAAALLSDWIAHLRDERRFAPNSVEAYERDVAAFLTWAGEPALESRKKTGLRVMLFLVAFTLIAYAAKRKIWAKIH